MIRFNNKRFVGWFSGLFHNPEPTININRSLNQTISVLTKKPIPCCLVCRNHKQPPYLGSSETTREASLFNFSNYQMSEKPNHIKSEQNQTYYDFLIWFIGFTEGDGSFICTEKRLCFFINQKDPKVLYKIKKQLGFGFVRQYSQNEKVYFRFAVTNKQNVLRLIHLFNGNLVLDHVYKRFEKWVDKANHLWQSNIIVKQTKPEVNLKNAWLSGFIEAEGGFYARIRKRPQMLVGYQLIMKFYITQKEETNILKCIVDLLESKVSVNSFHQNSAFYNRIEINSFLSHTILVKYLERYPCKGEKGVLIKRWTKVYWRREKKQHLTISGMKKLRQLCKLVMESQKKIEDIVHSE